MFEAFLGDLIDDLNNPLMELSIKPNTCWSCRWDGDTNAIRGPLPRAGEKTSPHFA
jgi:hypothetical protein